VHLRGNIIFHFKVLVAMLKIVASPQTPNAIAFNELPATAIAKRSTNLKLLIALKPPQRYGAEQDCNQNAIRKENGYLGILV
jgi:hypothetical protein